MTSTPRRRRPVVLVAEDDPTFLRLYEIWFPSVDFDLRLARDGLEALEAVERGGVPDVAFVDVEMPRLDGFELCRRLRELDPALPIAIVTGADELDGAPEHAGADLVLRKEAGGAAVVAAAWGLLADRRRRDVLRAAS